MTNISKNIAFVRKIQQQHGMTFLEVLVALVILVTGILGAVALQAVAKKNSFDTMQRSLASGLAQDIIERMRGNNIGVVGNYALGSPYSGGGGTAPTDCNILANNCNAISVTAHDLFEWQESLSGAGTKVGSPSVAVGGLVGGVGCINVTPLSIGGVVVSASIIVTISWQGRVEVADGAAASGVNCGTSGTKRRQVVVNAFII